MGLSYAPIESRPHHIRRGHMRREIHRKTSQEPESQCRLAGEKDSFWKAYNE